MSAWATPIAMSALTDGGLAALVAELRADAERCRRDHSLVSGDVVYGRIADLVESFVRERALDALTLQEAARELGRSYDTVQRAVRRGEIPNAGRKGAPRVLRCHLHSLAPGPDLRAGVAGEPLTERG